MGVTVTSIRLLRVRLLLLASLALRCNPVERACIDAQSNEFKRLAKMTNSADTGLDNQRMQRRS